MLFKMLHNFNQLKFKHLIYIQVKEKKMNFKIANLIVTERDLDVKKLDATLTQNLLHLINVFPNYLYNLMV